MSNRWIILKDDLTDLSGSSGSSLLTEDLYQASMENYVIDCGWYSSDEDDHQGRFITFLIKNQDWERPVLRLETLTDEDAKWSIQLFMKYCDEKGDCS